MGEPTPGPWHAMPLGGSSTVLSSVPPRHNDARTNVSFGYLGEQYSVGAPFIDDEGRARWDYVVFSHADASLIAAAHDMLDALRQWQAAERDGDAEELQNARTSRDKAIARAIARAIG